MQKAYDSCGNRGRNNIALLFLFHRCLLRLVLIVLRLRCLKICQAALLKPAPVRCHSDTVRRDLCADIS